MFFIIATLIIFILGILGFFSLLFLKVKFDKFFYGLLVFAVYLIFLFLYALKQLLSSDNNEIVDNKFSIKESSKTNISKKKVSFEKKPLIKVKSPIQKSIRGAIHSNNNKISVMNGEITIIPALGKTKGDRNQCLYYALSQVLYNDQKHNCKIYNTIFNNLDLIQTDVLLDSGFFTRESLRKEFKTGNMGDGFLTTIISQLTKRNTVILHLHLNKGQINGYFAVYYSNGKKHMFQINDMSNKKHLYSLLSDPNTLKLFHADYHFETFEAFS